MPLSFHRIQGAVENCLSRTHVFRQREAKGVGSGSGVDDGPGTRGAGKSSETRSVHSQDPPVGDTHVSLFGHYNRACGGDIRLKIDRDKIW